MGLTSTVEATRTSCATRMRARANALHIHLVEYTDLDRDVGSAANVCGPSWPKGGSVTDCDADGNDPLVH